MKEITFLFPHIPRLFSASVTSSLKTWSRLLFTWSIVGLLITINRFWPALTFNPLSTQSQPVLGVTTQPTVTQEQLDHWRRMIEEKPDYRDAYIKAATIAFYLGNIKEARMLIAGALALDPNSPSAQELSTLLEETEK